MHLKSDNPSSHFREQARDYAQAKQCPCVWRAENALDFFSSWNHLSVFGKSHASGISHNIQTTCVILCSSTKPALILRGTDSARPRMMCCGIWVQDILISHTHTSSVYIQLILNCLISSTVEFSNLRYIFMHLFLYAIVSMATARSQGSVWQTIHIIRQKMD